MADGYLLLPTGAATSSYAETPSAAALNVGVVDAAFDLQHPNLFLSNRAMGGKWGHSDSRSWMVQIRSSGIIKFSVTPDGTFANRIEIDSTSAIPVSSDQRFGLRVRFDPSTGSGYSCEFYYTSDGTFSGWTQLGTTVTGTATSIFAGTDTLKVGGVPGVIWSDDGRVYRFELKDDTTVVANPDFTSDTQGWTVGTGATGTDGSDNSWTLRSDSEWVAPVGETLPAPSGFTFAAAAGLRQLDGGWTSVSGATGGYDWEVERNDAGTWVAFESANTVSTSFQLTNTDGVDWGKTYRGRVRAVVSA